MSQSTKANLPTREYRLTKLPYKGGYIGKACMGLFNVQTICSAKPKQSEAREAIKAHAQKAGVDPIIITD